MISAVISLGGIGLGAAVILGLAAKKFAVEVDPKEEAILEVLPGANCGACGFPGCGGFAKAVVAGEADPSACSPGGSSVTAKIAEIMGVEAASAEPMVAVVNCQGDNQKAQNKYKYLGIQTCASAQMLAGGPKACPGGCLGLGDCMVACPFGAIEITAEGLAVINREKCVGCKKCVSACPRNVITMVPKSATVSVLCNSHDKGPAVKKYCQVGCIGCTLCKKTAEEVYAIDNFLAHVTYDTYDHEKAKAGMEKCPTKCIRDFAEGYPEGSSFQP
ncbi:MAG: RnfABCDGE type electron transport complex subunit B [Deltaproteobacteria bacterium]|nr:RnfABCDGE type electron transport complex subunit B [Deltaproteobacteria bacterium]